MVKFKVIDGALWQWDLGRKIAVFCDDASNISEIHFSNPTSDTCLIVIPESNGNELIASIPNILLESPQTLELYAVIYTDDGERTYAKYAIPVKQRQKPDDYVYTETEVMNYSTLNKRIDEFERTNAQTVNETVSLALAQAKESGEFDGAQGAQGEKGEKGDKGDPGVNGVDGKDGYTPVKGVDYFDGADGKNGVDGKDGKDGEKGADGYTPIKGVDYYTEADKSEFSEYIASELAKRGQLKPELAESKEWLEENGDASKLYVLPDGYIYAYMLTEVKAEPPYTNQIPRSFDLKDGVVDENTPYVGLNGEDGYKVGWRFSSSAVEKELASCCVTGYIPVKEGDVVRIKNVVREKTGYGTIYFMTADNQITPGAIYTDSSTGSELDSGGIYTFTVPDSPSIQYMRLTAKTIDDTSIITVNEDIVEYDDTTTGYAWANTGLAFVPADYEGRILDLENKVEELVNEVTDGVVFVDKSTMFISPEGDDNNDGLTESTPKKTVKACVNAGAKRISAKRGVYKQYIQMWDIDELEIFPTDNDKTFVVGEDREPIVFEMTDRIELSSLVAYNSIKRVAYTNAANYQFDKVFIKKTLTPIVSDYGSRYNSTVWLLSDDEKTACIKLKPVLTVAECEAETNTFTYVDGYIYVNADLTNVTQFVVPTWWDTGFYINGAKKVLLREVEVRFSGAYNIDIRNCSYFDFYKCSCKYTSYASGFHPINSNGVMTACYATKNYDGYGITGHGHTTYIDCVSEFNFDDGMSHHNACEGTVIGGRYEGNGKGGNTPAYGAKVNIYGGVYKNNGMYGIGYLYYSANGAASGIVQGAVMDGNPIGLAVNANCPVTVISPIFKNNTKDKEYKGTVTEY